MTDFFAAFRVVNARNCPFYEAEQWLVLTSQALQVPSGQPACLLLVREVTGLLVSLLQGVESDFVEERKNTYTCGGCSGLIKFRIEDAPEGVLQKSGDPHREAVSDFHRESVRDLERKGSVVSGMLEELSPTELLQFFHMHQKTGKLLLHVPAGIGRVAFREGAIIGAKFGEKEGRDAIFALLGEHKGRFNFVAGIPATLHEIEEVGDFMMLLMEGIKRLDEAKGEGR